MFSFKGMKKYTLSFLPFLLIVSICCKAQNLNWRAFDTNGPMGECLFPQNEEGEIVYSEVISCDLSADTIFGLAKEFIYDVGKRYKADCKIELEGVTKLACHVKMPIGKEYFSFGVFSPDNIATFERAHSEVSFDMLIEIRKGKYRYTLNNFFTQRRRIPGEGKSDGPSNMIHWQRINSLKKEMPSQGKRREEQQRIIKDEEITYQAEYNAVQEVIKGVKEFTVIDEDFE